MNPRFSPKALAFLRALKRHNDRDWFKARKDQYDELCRAPMLAVIDRPGWVWIGGGMYAPDTSQVQAVREHIAANVRKLRSIVESPGFQRRIGKLEGERLQRIPRGFPKDHPAAEYLKYRQFLAGAEFPSAFATSSKFYGTLIAVFRQVVPLARFLNAPLQPEPR